jgi:anti-sigma factor RsiW
VNCTEFLAKLTDYFDGQIDPELLAEVKEHLGSCHHCEVVVSTTKQTISIYRHQQPYDFPDELSDRLRSAIMKRCFEASCSGDKTEKRGRAAEVTQHLPQQR